MVIAVLPPGGIARSRSLCKQLRARFAQLKLLVLCWQYTGDQPQVRQSFLAAGADSVSFSLLETRALIANLAGDPVPLTRESSSVRQEAVAS